ncbi:MAG: hypothetical protein AABW51_05610 [Nanoarchaeota archaeon]
MSLGDSCAEPTPVERENAAYIKGWAQGSKQGENYGLLLNITINQLVGAQYFLDERHFDLSVAKSILSSVQSTYIPFLKRFSKDYRGVNITSVAYVADQIREINERISSLEKKSKSP